MTARCIALLILTLGIAAPGRAADICVTNMSQLQQAAQIAASNGQDDEIRLEAVSFAPPASNTQAAFDYRPGPSDLARTLKISGGWTVGTGCAEQFPNATLTLLNLQGKVGFHFNVEPPAEFLGSVTIENLYLVGAGAAQGWGRGRALDWDMNSGSSARLLADRLVILFGDDSWAGAVRMEQSGGGTMTLRNSIIGHHLGEDRGIQFAAVNLEALDGAHGYLVNNSIHDNVGAGGVAGVRVAGKVDLYNNVIANNTATELVHVQFEAAAGSEITLVANHIATQFLPEPPLMNVSNTSGPASWSLSGDYRILSTGSTLRDTGFNNPPGGLPETDVFGNPRADDGAVDRGALEGRGGVIFRNGFEL